MSPIPGRSPWTLVAGAWPSRRSTNANGISIHVPASFLARAELPLTIDPVVSTFVIDVTGAALFSPDVAYDSTTGRYLTVASQLYVEFKLDQGFTEVEVVGKQRSLKGVQEPFSTQGNIDCLKRAGFVDIMTIMKSICFEGFVAIK